MNKPEAIARLDALEAEAKKLRAIINAPEASPLLCPGPWRIFGDALCGTFSSGQGASTLKPRGNAFPDNATAIAYAVALDTFMLLRQQPGTEPAKCGVTQYVMTPGVSARVVECIGYAGDLMKMAQLSPCFNSPDALCAAVKAVGEQRIVDMFKTFHHVKG